MGNEGLGGIDEDELRAFMASHPTFDEAGTNIQARFARAVAQLLLQRITRSEPSGFAVFALSESLAADIETRTVSNVPFLNSGSDSIVEGLWLVQAELKNAYRLTGPPLTQTDLFKRLTDAGLAGHAAIVVDARVQPWQPRLYPYGIQEPEFWIAVDLSDGPIPEVQLKETVNRFWNQGLRTPELARQSDKPVWKNAALGIPNPRPEQRIQWRLRDTLIGAFPRRHIRAETRTEEGRGDIFIMADVTARAGTPAQSTDWVLELKALCDMTSNDNAIPDAKAKSDAALMKGVIQATGYRSVQNGVQAALCCFEMRATDDDDDACFSPIRSKADKEDIRLWRWFLFRSVDDARMARFG